MFTQGATGQYWPILDNISQFLTVFGNIWTKSECFLQYPNSDKTDLKQSKLNNIEQFQAILDNIGQYWQSFFQLEVRSYRTSFRSLEMSKQGATQQYWSTLDNIS